ncbi:MAG: cupin domain-containing protein [Christensenellales bacterium]
MIQKGNLHKSANEINELFQYVKAGQLNDHVLTIVAAENRTLDFHIHEESDELFYVIEGCMQIETEEGIISLSEGDFLIVPKGVRHRPVCTTLVKCLLIEKSGTLRKENTGGTYGG